MEEALTILIKPAFEVDQIEAVKPEINSNFSRMDSETNSYEGDRYSYFRDHTLDQPFNGIRYNFYSISEEFHSKYYVIQNIVMTEASEVNLDQFSELVQKHFGDVRAEVQDSNYNSERPFFTDSLMFQRDVNWSIQQP